MTKKISKREQVKELIKAGESTKDQIAEALGTTVGSVNSQCTYLRWMGFFIKYDADKVLSFCTEDEHEAWKEELKANRKTKSVSNLSPEEQATRVAKTLKNQNKTLVTWNNKLESAQSQLDDDPESEDLQDLVAEAEANITILEIKIKRNEAKADDLPEPVEAEPEVVEAPAEEDGEDLL